MIPVRRSPLSRFLLPFNAAAAAAAAAAEANSTLLSKRVKGGKTRDDWGQARRKNYAFNMRRKVAWITRCDRDAKAERGVGIIPENEPALFARWDSRLSRRRRRRRRRR